MAQDDPVAPRNPADKAKDGGPRVETSPDELDSPESVSVANVAKWLVPSVTALFVVVGYVVQSAQQDLLGLHYADRESGTLIVSASDFFRDLVAIPAAMGLGLVAGDPVSLGGHGPEILFATILVAAALLLPKLVGYLRRPPAWLTGYQERNRAWVIAGLLCLIVAGKFALLDEPLFQVRNVVLGVWVEPPLGDELARTFLERATGSDLDPEASSHERSRVETILASIVCSRISLAAARRDRLLEVYDLCTREQSVYKLELRGRFIAQLWATLLILIVATALLRSRGRSRMQVALAVLALTYSLIIVYAYGKLQRSTYFDFGMVRLAEASRGPQGAEYQPGLILSRSDAGTTLLVETEGPCSVAALPSDITEGPEQAEAGPRYAHVTLMALSPSQVLAVERIYRQDVIAWAIRSERKCPPPPSPL